MPETTQSTAEIRRGEQPDVVPFPPVIERAVSRAGRPLGFMWAHGFRFLVVLDALSLYLLMVVISFVRFGFSFEWDTYPLSRYFVGFAIATVIQLVINYFDGLYERERYLMPRLNLAVYAVLASFVLVANRQLSRRLALRRQGAPRVVLVGSSDSIDLADRHLVESDREAVVVDRVASPLLLTEAVERHRATDVLLLDVTAFGSVYPEPLNTLDARGVGFLQRVSARETLLGLKTVRQVAGMPFVPLRPHTVSTHKARLKRVFDLVVLVLFAPLWVPVVAMVALYVLISSGRPVLYRQTRVGRDGATFRCVKFRTMVPDAEADGQARLAAEDDDRVVPALRWMRATRADELPQLWNVLKGEMSLVGPRPERPELVAEIVERVPGYIRRNELPPGLTGLAQIHGRYGTDAEYKLGYDLQYLVNWSIVIDVQILFRTVWVVLSRRV